MNNWDSTHNSRNMVSGNQQWPKSNANRMEDHWLMGETEITIWYFNCTRTGLPEAGQTGRQPKQFGQGYDNWD